jgi:cholesterol transport system auxiliary component
MIGRYLILATFFVLSGCSGMLKSEQAPLQTYVLNPASQPQSGELLAINLAIVQIDTTPGLATDRIALLRQPNRLDYYAEARWPDQLPRYLQAFVLHTAFNRGDIQSINNKLLPDINNYILDIYIIDFQAQYSRDGEENESPTIHVRLAATLQSAREQKLLGMLREDIRVQAQENRMEPIVLAFEQALQQATQQLLEKVRLRISAEQAESSS